jgi:pimeloyl-ACP methyl ester carboxylesterase
MSKARIIYITGMKPKPDPELHRPELLRVLRASLARIAPAAAGWLDARAENFVLVSWTSLLYPHFRDIELDRPGVELLLEQPYPSAADRREANAPRRVLRRWWHLLGDSFPALSSVMASHALKVTLSDVHRYLDNTDGVADRIRALVIAQLDAAWTAGDRVLLIGHSLGSVIAWDALWQLSREAQGRGRVEVLMTLGSPLATRFIRKGLRGAGRPEPECYPANIDRWVNVAARGEMVSLHRRVRPFFAGMLRYGLVQSIDDEADIYNHFRSTDGFNPHKSYGYLNHATVARRICRWLGYSS